MKARPRDVVDSVRRDVDKAHLEVAEAIPDMVFRIGGDFRYREFIPGSAGLQPFASPEAFLGRTIDDIMPADHAIQAKVAVRDALNTGEIVRLTYTLKVEGELRFYECRMVPSGDDEVMAFVRDYTDDRTDGHEIYGLSKRELTVLSLLVRGVTDKDIAKQLDVSVFTVNKHVASVLAKMDAASRTEAAVRAEREHIS